MPDPTDLVTNLPADFEVFGQAVDSTLADLKGGTTGQVLKKNTNTDMDFVWSADAAGMTNPMTTTGDVIYSSPGSNPVRLGIGTTGQVLTVSSGVPAWTTPAGGGKVLQVVQGTTASVTTISSTTYTDTGLTASITPTLATSKILVMFSQVSSTARNAIEAGSGIQLLRGATAVYQPAPGGYETQYIYGTGIGTSGTNIKGIISATYLDSPATTSATTYKTQVRTQNSTSSASVSLNDGISTMILMEIGA